MLKPYVVDGGDMEEGACLVFAHNVQEARKVAWKEVSWIEEAAGGEWIYVRAKLLPREEWDYWFTIADQEKLKKEVPHAIEDPPACKKCGYWTVLNKDGLCKRCAFLTEVKTLIGSPEGRKKLLKAMNKLAFAVHPGYVKSKDGDFHYITVDQIVRLYGLRPGEFVIWNGTTIRNATRGRRWEDYIHLFPSENYDLEEVILGYMEEYLEGG